MGGQYEDSLEMASKAIELQAKLFGAGTLALIPALTVAGEASVALGCIRVAEDYLWRARWSLAKSVTGQLVDKTVCPEEVQARLCIAFGNYFIAKEDLERAQKEFANAAYLHALIHGPHHPAMSESFFHLGRTFQLQEQLSIASTLFARTATLWRAHLEEHFLSVPPRTSLHHTSHTFSTLHLLQHILAHHTHTKSSALAADAHIAIALLLTLSPSHSISTSSTSPISDHLDRASHLLLLQQQSNTWSSSLTLVKQIRERINHS